MALVLNEDQQLLQRTAHDFARTRSSLKRIRALRDGGDALGFSRDLWRDMAALGWAGIPIPEAYGGAGLGQVELAVVMEELGRGLVPEPMLSTVCLGANAIVHGGTEEQKREILPAVASGDTLLAVGWAEAKSRFDPHRVAVRARRARDRWRLEGEKRLVLDGHAADRLIVSARTAGAESDREGITLFLVDPRAPGVSVTRQSLLDGRGAAIVRLEDASVDDRSVLGEAGRGGHLLERVIDCAAAALAAEMLGSMSAVFEMTLEYLKTRKQFGVPIGSFQALKHRAAVVYTEIQLTRSAVLGASGALDAGAEDAADLVAIAKARASDAFLLAANEAVQMHGGIGMTDEHDVGFFLKRARAAEMTFGDAAWHRARFADRHGY